MDSKKEKKSVFHDNLKTALYVVVGVVVIGFFSAVFFKPVFLVQFIILPIVLVGLALPIGITYMLNVREALNLSVRGIVLVSLPVILFFGIMLPGVGPIAMPGAS